MNPITQMLRFHCKESRITKNHVNMISTKEPNKAPSTGLKEMEIYELSKNSLKKKSLVNYKKKQTTKQN